MEEVSIVNMDFLLSNSNMREVTNCQIFPKFALLYKYFKFPPIIKGMFCFKKTGHQTSVQTPF